ncbi:hypothetical protein [Salisediminibacterium beveridgei]|uniref:Uncharacterized protein n=1 Tax=Salisediminibacterium beveridgei TaxID=632773 RepID=A0A1D7QZK2_9BACI|nr:hypothetical protein [Salisediminibacterium beveridgei]AOM84435.1 hypothetical protein BBEV_3118 [Salisediminibacterium beveridgei]
MNDKIESALYYSGLCFILMGMISFLVIGVYLNVVTFEINSAGRMISSIESHPMSWYIGFGYFVSTSFFGLILLGIGRIILYLDYLRKDNMKLLEK